MFWNFWWFWWFWNWLVVVFCSWLVGYFLVLCYGVGCWCDVWFLVFLWVWCWLIVFCVSLVVCVGELVFLMNFWCGRVLWWRVVYLLICLFVRWLWCVGVWKGGLWFVVCVGSVWDCFDLGWCLIFWWWWCGLVRVGCSGRWCWICCVWFFWYCWI